MVARSSPIVVGTVASPAARSASTAASRVGDRRIVGLGGGGEARVGQRIFVRAIDRGFGGQRAEPLQRGVHLLGACPRTGGRSPSRTRCRRRTRRPRRGRSRRYGPACGRALPRLRRHDRRSGPCRPPSARHRAFGILAASAAGAGHGAPVAALDRRVAAGVIGVPVGVPDLSDAPAARFGGGEHRSRHRPDRPPRSRRCRRRGPARGNCR